MPPRQRRRLPFYRTLMPDFAADREARPIRIYALLTIVAGGVVFHLLEGRGWLDAYYFAAITLPTIGYGDLARTTPISKVFTIFYAINGIAVLLALHHSIRKVRQREVASAQAAPADSRDA